MHSSTLILEYLASEPFTHILDGIGGTMFFLKDRDFEIISGNLLMAEHCGFDSVDELRGKTDFDIFPHELAVHYRTDDEEVLTNSKSKLNIVELFPNHVGTLQWIVCNKTPVLDSAGAVQGLIGICQPFEKSQVYARPFKDIAESLDYLKENYTKKIYNQELAARSGLSVRQFEKRFKQLFNTSIHQYILDLRVLKACELLVEADSAVADIATKLGFYDQSAFISCFRRRMKMTPLQYINRHFVRR